MTSIDFYIFCFNGESIDIHWIEAEEYCIDYASGHLASFSNQSSMASFLSLREEMGIESKEITFGIYSNYYGVDTEWNYTDGSSVAYSNWDTAGGQPDLPPSACS